jgi:hypothetical protein
LKDKHKKRVQKLGSAEKIFASNPLRHTIQKMHTDLSTIIVDKISMQNIVVPETQRNLASSARRAMEFWSISARFFLESVRIK